MTTNLVNLSKDIEIEFKDKEARTFWRRWKHGLSNSKLVQFTTAWIKCMQYLMKDEGKLTNEIIGEAFTAALNNYEICLFVIGSAKDVIEYCWKYGSDFKNLDT